MTAAVAIRLPLPVGRVPSLPDHLVSSTAGRASRPGRAVVSIADLGSRRRRESSDEALIRTLYHEHGRALLAYATRLTGDRAAAEDVVQETLIRAWKHAESMVNEKGSVRGWLLTVAATSSPTGYAPGRRGRRSWPSRRPRRPSSATTPRASWTR